MPDWWDNHPAERYWCEITDRDDIGVDLRTPQHRQDGRSVWHYSLVADVRPGDIVFHYRGRAFIAASVAGGPLESGVMDWTPHIVRRPEWRGLRVPSWLLPLSGTVWSDAPLSLEQLRSSPIDSEWIVNWNSQKRRSYARVASPFMKYGNTLRGNDAYLTKMPAEFVARFGQLRELASRLEDRQEELNTLNDSLASSTSEPNYRDQSASEYWAHIQGGHRRVTRRHAALVNGVSAWLSQRGLLPENPFPLDMALAEPAPLIIEAKTVGPKSPLLAVRHAVGQLHEYKYFGEERFRDADLCILLDAEPDHPGLVEYVEAHLGMLISWWTDHTVCGGPKTGTWFSQIGAAVRVVNL